MYVIILNKNNMINGDNNTLEYKFPSSAQFNDDSIAVSSISMYYSWFNISSALANNTLSYSWTSGVTTTTYTITIPDGLYEIDDLNSLFHYEQVKNKTYLIDSSGEYVYYFDFEINRTRYAIQLDTRQVPTALPVGYTAPALFVGFPTQSFNPIITISNNFSGIVGYVPSSGVFSSNNNVNNAYTPPTPPTQSTFYESKTASGTLSYLSNVSPNVQPNSSLYLSVSGIDNKYATPSSIIYSIVPNVGLGSQIVEKPPTFVWNTLTKGFYNTLRVQILGSDFSPIKINDPNMTIILVIKDHSNKH